MVVIFEPFCGHSPLLDCGELIQQLKGRALQKSPIDIIPAHICKNASRCTHRCHSYKMKNGHRRVDACPLQAANRGQLSAFGHMIVCQRLPNHAIKQGLDSLEFLGLAITALQNRKHK